MGPVWTQAHLTGNLWLPLLWLLLSQVCCSHALPGWRFTSSEVVIPRRVSHRVGGAAVPDRLSYKIHFRGRRHVVHMKVKKNLLPRQFPVITSNDQGAMQEDYPFVPRDCYYYSYLEGVPGSMGTLETCYGGLRGMLQVDDYTYEIKPLEASSKFEHVVSLLVSEELSPERKRCSVEEEDENLEYEEGILGETPRASPVYKWWPHRKYLKVHYTVSNSLYRMRPNMTFTIESVVMMNNVIHSIYYQNLLEVHIRVMCIWDGNEPVKMTSSHSGYSATEAFGLWKFWGLYQRIPHDTSILLSGNKFNRDFYYAHFDGTCNPNWGSTFVYVANYHVFLASCVAAHTLGHSLGLSHDVSGCKCFRRTNCLMAPIPGINDMLSNCSYSRLYHRASGWDACLSSRNTPYNNFPYVAPRCGDGIINGREECDCGSFKECANDKCCETSCALTLGSDCSRGGCCRKCKYAPPGWVCRGAAGICDLSEYCDGKTHTCPDDFYIQDGTPCSALAVCVKGNCTDRDMQCQTLFGFRVRDAMPVCYQKLNIRADRFGNCGVKMSRAGMKPSPCEPADVFCGMLHCRNVRKVPGGGEHTTFRHIIVKDVQNIKCFGSDAHYAMDVPEFGLVMDGATCGPGRFCLNQNCTFYDDLGFDCDVKTCHFRGVCNNKKHCHCQRGWNPPDCNTKGGGGGSIDSGPPPKRELGLRGRILVRANYALLLIIFRLILLLFAFILGCISFLRADEEEEEEEEIKNKN